MIESNQVSMPRLILAYKNFAANQNISHIGLGVAALNTSQGSSAQRDRRGRLAGHQRRGIARSVARSIPPRHVVVSAPWIPSPEVHTPGRARTPPHRFAVNCHSNVGFLQADANGVKLVREAMEIEAGDPQFSSRRATA